MRILNILIGIALFGCLNVSGQDSSLLKMLDDSLAPAASGSFITGTFKGTHIINMQSIEQPAIKALSFIMMHRFGKLNDGAYNLFGLDQAEIRLGFDYGISNRLSLGVGRSSLDKTFDGSIKYKILRQTEQTHQVPLSMSIFTEVVFPTLKYTDKPYINSKYRTIYASQFLLARKMNRNLSLQINPTWLHFNLVEKTADKNEVFGLGVGGRMKFNKRMSINLEYNYLPTGQVSSTSIRNSFSAGWDIETGGHVFQLVFSNSVGMVEPYYMAKTTGTWGKGDIYFGFNISRDFSFKK